MSHKTKNQSVILLVNDCAEETSLVKIWLEENNFLTHETKDVFEALEEISDYTVSRCPDVILLSVESPSKDCGKITEMVRVYSDSNDISVVAMPHKNKVAGKKSNFTQLFAGSAAKTGGLLPALSRTASGKFL